MSSLAIGVVAVGPAHVASAMPPDAFTYPDDYATIQPDCFGPNPAVGCDDYGDDKYERPVDPTTGDYFPALDITQVALGTDADFTYFAVETAGSIGLLPNESFGFTIDIDPQTGSQRPDFLVYSSDTENLPAGVWGQSGLQIALDGDSSVGGADPTVPGEAPGDGFETPIPLADNVFVRRIGSHIEVAVRTGVAGVDPANLQFRAFSTVAPADTAGFMINDVFPDAFILSADSSSGFSDRLSTVVAPQLDLGGVADSATTPQNTAVGVNVLTNDSLGPNVVLDSIETASLYGGIVVDNGGGNLTYIPVPSFSGTDRVRYTLRDTVTGDIQVVNVSILVDAVPLPPFGAALAGGSLIIPECGLAITLDQEPNLGSPGNPFDNIGFIPTGSGPPGSLDPGIHISRQQFGAAGTNDPNFTGNSDPGLGSAITLNFSRPIDGLQLGFQAQQAEELFTFSQPAAQVTGIINSTFGVAAPAISRVSLESGNTVLRSDMTGTFGSTLTDAFGANSEVTWDFTGSPQTSLRIEHSGPLTDARTLNGATVYNGSVIVGGPVSCPPLVDRVGVAKSAGAVADNGDGSFTVTYTYEVENLGNTTLQNLQVVDDLDAPGRFGTYVAGTPTNPGEYTVSAPVITFNVADPLVANTGFTGSGVDNTLFDGTSGDLRASETAEVDVDVTFVPDFSGGDTVTIQNQVTATAEGPTDNRPGITTTTTDDSTDGKDPDPNSDGVPDEDTPTTIVVSQAHPAIDVVKSLSTNADEDGSNTVSLGDTLTYQFEVTNSGQVQLQDVTVADPVITDPPNSGTIICPSTTLAAGASTTCTGDYTVTQADVNAGQIQNTAVASGDPDGPGGDPPVDSPPSDEDVPVPQVPEIDLDKSFDDFTDNDTSGTLNAGDDINYSFTITNTGNTTLTGVNLQDSRIPAYAAPVSCGALTTLEPGDTTSCTGSYVVQPGDVGATIVNTAVALGTPPPSTGIPQVGDSDDESVTPDTNPAIQLTKSFTANADEDGSNSISDGDTLTYEFVVENTGDVALDPIMVTDPTLPGLSPIDCGGVTSLGVGATLTCSATFVVSQADVDRGVIANLGFVTGQPPTPPGGPTPPTVDDDDPEIVLITADPSLTIAKTFTGVAPVNPQPGDSLTYDYLVTNTGNVTLTGVEVDDDQIGTVSCSPSTLLPGESVTCAGSYTIQPGDIAAGSVLNVATATGQPPTPGGGGPTPPPVQSPPDDENVDLPQVPSIAMVKSRTTVAPSPAQLNSVISYEFVVTNTGNVELTGVEVDDDVVGTVPCSPSTLAPGASVTCPATYTVNQDDVDAGNVYNTAIARGTPPPPPNSPPGTPPPPPIDSPPDDHDEPIPQTPSIGLDKSFLGFATGGDVDSEGDIDAGDTIEYQFTITNTGSVTLTNVAIGDQKIQFPAPATPAGTFLGPCGADTTLLPGASTTCSATYVVTAADVASGAIDNTATATGEDPDGGEVTDDDDERVVPQENPSISIDKSLGSISNDIAPLGQVSEGDELTYEFAVTNTGDVPLSNVSVADPLAGLSSIDCGGVTNLTVAPAAGSTFTCTATYTVTLTDVDNGSIPNTATASGDSPGGSTVTDDDPENVSVPQNPGISIDKQFTAITNDVGGDGNPDAGDTIEYTFTITNTGNVDLTTVSVTDPLAGLTPDYSTGLTCGSATLAPGQTESCTADYVVPAGGGDIDNTATVSGQPPTPLGGTTPPPITDDDDERVTPTINPSIAIAKTITSKTAAGAAGDVDDVVAYEFVVTNDGDVDLAPVTVSDPLTGLSPIDCGAASPAPGNPVTITTLALGASVTCTASYAITQADLDAGRLDNTATATGTPPTGGDVTDDDPAVLVPLGNASISVVKSLASVTPTGPVSEGDVLTYDFVVTNTGDVSLVNVAVSDPLPGLSAIDCGAANGNDDTIDAAMTPGDSVTCSATYTVLAADIAAGAIDNTATVDGETPTGTPVTDDDDERVTPNQNPSISIDKSAATPVDVDGSGDASVSDTIDYTFTVTNTGDVTLTDISFDDPTLGITDDRCNLAGPGFSLAPGATTTCTSTYTIDQDDLDAVGIDNTAAVEGTPPVGPPVTDDDDERVDLPPVTELDIVKTISASTPVNPIPGDTIDYEFLVTNTGNVTLTNVTVVDNLRDISTPVCPPGPLAPGASTTCTASYVLKASDVDFEELENVARATGTPPTLPPTEPALDPPVSPPDDALIPFVPAPALSLFKTIDGGDPDPATVNAGDVVTYRFNVRNIGNVTLTDVTVIDPKPGLSPVDCGVDGVNDNDNVIPVMRAETATTPRDEVTCTATYTITQADVDAQEVRNSATATGQPPDPNDPPVVTPPSPTMFFISQQPSIEIDKDVQGGIPAIVVADDVITYTFLVTNTGNVTLTNVVVDDPLPGLGTIGCPVTVLAPAESTLCAADYTVTQADVDGGIIENAATASGTPPPSPLFQPPPVTSPPDEVDIPIPPTPAITIDKDVDGGVPSDIALGDVITYVFDVANTGNVTLTDITVTDPLPGLPSPTCAASSLDPGDTTRCTADYTVTSDDIAAGFITNTAFATGQPPTPPQAQTPPPTNSPPDTVTVPSDPKITTTKEVTAGPTALGDGSYDVTYQIQVANGGNVELSNVQIVENLADTFARATTFEVVRVTSTDFELNAAFDGATVTDLLDGTDVLPVNEGGSLDLVVNVTPGADKGPYLNTAIGQGTPPVGPEIEDPSDSGTNGCNSPCDNVDPDDPHPGEPGDTGGVDDPTPVRFPQGFDLSLTKDYDQAASSADTAVFDFVVTNSGDEDAQPPITLRDNLPPALTFVSAATPANWSCSMQADDVVCTGSEPMSPGDVVSLSIITSVTPGATSVTNQADVESVGGVAIELDVTNNDDSAEVPRMLLPDTGADATTRLLALGFALIAAGVLVLLSGTGRRRRAARSPLR